ncbi:Anaphase-promoting complex subunit 5 [Geranomyces michiganensis]|nr:Anaphase-promoting complex subunit 5 [Geranomyces michiganensis]
MQGIPLAHVANRASPHSHAPPLWTSFITPHKVAVFFLLEMYLDLPEDCPSDFERGMISLLLEETSLTSHSSEDRSFEDLLQKVSAMRYLERPEAPEQELLTKVHKAASSIENMFDCFEAMISEVESADEDSPTAARFNARSPFGYFIRFVLADVEEMKDNFGLAGDFFDGLQLYAHKADAANPTYSDGGLDASTPIVVSTIDAERFFDAQAEALEDNTVIIGPAQLQRKIELYRHQDVHGKAAWSSYLNCLRASDLPGALQNLLRYFTFFTKDHSPQANDWVQHYALLNTASLYARFNHLTMALEAVNMAIPRALEMKDGECLKLLQNPERVSGDQEEIDSDNATMRSITALGQAQRHLEMSSGPERAFEVLARSADLNCTHDLDTATGTERLIRADAWKAYGRHDLAALNAHMYVNGGKDVSPEDKPLGLCLLALQYGAQADYRKVLDIMQAAKRAYPPFASGNAADRWISTLMDILFQRALRRLVMEKPEQCEMHAAELFASYYAAIAEGDPHMAPMVQIHQALIAAKWGRLSEAYKNLTALIKDIGGPNARNKAMLIECNLHIVDFHLESNSALAALPRVLASLTLASQCSYNVLRDRAVIAFAKVVTDLDDSYYHTQALAAIESVMPSVWAGQSVDVTADAELTLVETKMLCGALRTAGQVELTQMLRMVESGEQGYRKLDDLDGLDRALTTKANLLRKAGLAEEAEATAGEVRALDATKQIRMHAAAPRDVSAAVVSKSADDEAMAALFDIDVHGAGR